MSEIRFGPSDKESTPEEIVVRAKEMLKAMSMDPQQTFAWMRNRIYDELEPEVARLKSDLARKDAALREAARATCEGCRLAWKFSDGWRHTEPMPIICEAQAIRSALTPARETGETK